MRIYLVLKDDLTPDQVRELNNRFQSSINLEGECGPIRAWHTYSKGLYAFVTLEGNIPIAITEASGRPTCSPGWWIAPEYRGQKYGNELVDLLAEYLRTDGVTAIGRNIPIQTPNNKYDAQSCRLVARLRRHFP